MRASKQEGEWKCFKKAGRGSLRTAGFKHIGKFSKSRGIFDSNLTHQGMRGEQQRTKEPSIPEGLDLHMAFLIKNAMLNTTNTASSFFLL